MMLGAASFLQSAKVSYCSAADKDAHPGVRKICLQRSCRRPHTPCMPAAAAAAGYCADRLLRAYAGGQYCSKFER
jgi:hypothetical protein